MGDLKKVISKPLKYLAPVLGAAFGAGLIGGGTFSIFGKLFAPNALQGYMLGSALVGLGSKKKLANGGPAESPAYGFGRPQNTLSDTRAVPIVYGKVKVSTGNTIWVRTKNSGQERDQAVALCAGEVESVSDLRINNRPVTDFDGASATAYTGTAAQTPDATRMAGYYKGSVKNIAYVAATIKASDEISGAPVISALVEGRKIKTYDGASWTTQYSNNAAWIIRDFLVNVVGIPESRINDASFYAVALWAAATVSGQYDRADNVATAGTITGGTNPTIGNDGSLKNSNASWHVNAAQDENLVYLGKLDLGSSKYTDLIKLHLYDGDDRVFYNYKIDVSTDDVSYDTMFDGTGTGDDYQGQQLVEFTARNVRYVKVYGTGSTLDTYFAVKELEVIELVAATRATLNGIIDSERPARDVLEDMLASCGCFMLYSGGEFKLIADTDSAAVMTFDTSTIVDGTMKYQQVEAIERPNRAVAWWINPHKNWTRDDAVDNDTAAQADDGVVQRDIPLLFCTSRSQAARLVRTAGNLARLVNWTATYEGAYDGLALEVGDIVALTDSDMGWTAKKFRIADMGELPDGRRRITAQEHIASIYADQAGIQFDPGDATGLPDAEGFPFQVSALAISEAYTQPGDGAYIPKINGTYTRPTGGAEWAYVIIQLSTDGGSTYTEVGRSSDGTFTIPELAAGQEYYIRVVSASAAGIKAPADTAPYDSITLAGKAAAPSNVSGFGYDLGSGVFKLRWNTATDINNDLSHYEIRDGASWAAGTTLPGAAEISTTNFALVPTKRTYQLWIKAFDRTGNESAAATELNVSKTAPVISGVPDVIQIPSVKLRVQFACTNDSSIIRYDIHASTSSSFSPGAGTLVTQAAASITGIGVGEFTGVVGNTYYVKVCPVDFLSDVVGDKYTYPSSEGSGLVRKIEGDDITANTILTTHLATSGIDVGGSGSKPIYIRVMNAASTVIGYIGSFLWNSVWRYGGRFLELVVGPDGDPALVVLANGDAYLKRGMNIGGTTDVAISNADPGMNLVPNGGFEEIVEIGHTNLMPSWEYTYSGTSSIYKFYGFDVIVNGAAYAAGGGRFSLGLYASTVTKTLARTPDSAKIRIAPSKTYQFSFNYRVNEGSWRYSDLLAKLVTYDEDEVVVREINAVSLSSLNSTTFAQATYQLDTGATEKFVRIIFYAGYCSSSDFVIIDDVQIEEGYQVSAYTESPRISPNMPLGMSLIAGKGFELFSSGVSKICIGDITGRGDGQGSTHAANTIGIDGEGSFFWKDAAGALMVGIDGGEEEFFINETITKGILTSVTQALMQSSGNSDSARPHDYQIGLMAAGTVSLRSSFPHAVAHGQSNVPGVVAFVRGYDSGTSTYSRWEQLPYHGIQRTRISGSESRIYETWFDVSIDGTYIYFNAMTGYMNFGDYCDACATAALSTTTKSYCYMRKASDGSWSNIWDTWQFTYKLLREGAT